AAAAAPRRAGLAPRLLDEDVAHGPGCGDEEMPPGLPGQVVPVGEAQVDLVDKGRRLQGLGAGGPCERGPAPGAPRRRRPAAAPPRRAPRPERLAAAP